MGDLAGDTAVADPRELYERMKQELWLGDGKVMSEDLWAEDVVVETPFGPPGTRRRIEGRTEWLAFSKASGAALPVRFEGCREVALHETSDPEVIVVEYELTGTVTTTGQRASASFVGVLRARNGQIAHWREYQDVLAMAEALDRPPALLDGIGDGQ